MMYYRLMFTARASGKSVEMAVVEVYSICEGLIVQLDLFYKDPSAVTFAGGVTSRLECRHGSWDRLSEILSHPVRGFTDGAKLVNGMPESLPARTPLRTA